MNANKSRVAKFFVSNETTFAIPLHQQSCDRTKIQCQKLLNDIVPVGSDDKQSTHVIGSSVYVHHDVYTASGLTDLTIIARQ